METFRNNVIMLRLNVSNISPKNLFGNFKNKKGQNIGHDLDLLTLIKDICQKYQH